MPGRSRRPSKTRCLSDRISAARSSMSVLPGDQFTCGDQGDDVHVVRKLYLVYLQGQTRIGNQVTQAQAGSAESLGKGTGNDDVGIVCDQFQAGHAAEFVIGLVDYDQSLRLQSAIRAVPPP